MVDGLDNMVTRYIVNRACVKSKITYVFGAAIGLEGNLFPFSRRLKPAVFSAYCLIFQTTIRDVAVEELGQLPE